MKTEKKPTRTTEFREDLFPLPPQFASAYWQYVKNGFDSMRQANIILCGLCRNIAENVPNISARLEALGQLFLDYRVLIYENDSDDGTPYYLGQWQAENERVYVTSEKHGDPVNPSTRCIDRVTRMARYRNCLRAMVLETAESLAVKHVVVIDLDLRGGWSTQGVANTFGRPEPWDFIGSNGVIFRDYGWEKDKQCYYDAWAFRWSGSDRPQAPEDINPIMWRKGAPLLPVNSCFGGMGIYRIEAFQRCSYEGWDVEHVPFHRRMRGAGMGRLYMNPSQICLYNPDDFDKV